MIYAVAEQITAELDDDALSDGGEELTEEQERMSSAPANQD